MLFYVVFEFQLFCLDFMLNRFLRDRSFTKKLTPFIRLICPGTHFSRLAHLAKFSRICFQSKVFSGGWLAFANLQKGNKESYWYLSTRTAVAVSRCPKEQLLKRVLAERTCVSCVWASHALQSGSGHMASIHG